jgi:hypothetical protein
LAAPLSDDDCAFYASALGGVIGYNGATGKWVWNENHKS